MSATQHIYFCADRKYLPCASATMASILANSNAQSSQVFHLISDDINSDDIGKLSELSNIKPCEIILHTISAANFAQYQDMNMGYMSLGTLYRFKILDFAPQDADKILYLDGDMIITAPLDELFTEDLGDNYAGVVEEKNAFQTQNLQLQSGQYFNAGMLLLNLKTLRGHNLLDEALAYYQQNKKRIVQHDQDILNGLWDTKVKFLHQKYNVPSFVKHFKNPLIIHYTGFVKKPWHAYCRHPQKNLWLKFAQMTPYKKSTLELLMFKLKRLGTKIFYFTKDPTHKKFYIISILSMNFTLGKKDNKKR